MKRKIILLLSLLIFSTQTHLFAKRAHVHYNDKVTVGNIEYKASYDNEKLLQKAYIIARDIKTDKIIWKKKIYQVELKPNLEQDIQWIMITEVKYYKNALFIANKRGKLFFIDLTKK